MPVGNRFKRMTPGNKTISASAWNAFIDTARTVKADQFSRGNLLERPGLRIWARLLAVNEDSGSGESASGNESGSGQDNCRAWSWVQVFSSKTDGCRRFQELDESLAGTFDCHPAYDPDDANPSPGDIVELVLGDTKDHWIIIRSGGGATAIIQVISQSDADVPILSGQEESGSTSGQKCKHLFYHGIVQDYDETCDRWLDGRCAWIADVRGRPLEVGERYLSVLNGTVPQLSEANPLPVGTPCESMGSGDGTPIYWVDVGDKTVTLEIRERIGYLCQAECGEAEPTPPCEFCSDGTPTELEFDITVTGACSAVSGTITLTQTEDETCRWEDESGDWYATFSHGERLRVYYDDGAGCSVVYEIDLPIDCCAELVLDINTAQAGWPSTITLTPTCAEDAGAILDNDIDATTIGDCGQEPVYEVYAADVIRFNHSSCLWETISPDEYPVYVFEKRGRALTNGGQYTAHFERVVSEFDIESSYSCEEPTADSGSGCHSYPCRPLYMVECAGLNGQFSVVAKVRCELVEDEPADGGTPASYRRIQKVYRYVDTYRCGELICRRGPEFWHNAGCCECDEGAVDDNADGGDYDDGEEDCCGGAHPGEIYATVSNAGSLNGSYLLTRGLISGCTGYTGTFSACGCTWTITLRCNCGAANDKDWTASIGPSVPCTWTCDPGSIIGSVTSCRPFYGRYTFAFLCNCGGTCSCSAEDFENVVIEFSE